MTDPTTPTDLAAAGDATTRWQAILNAGDTDPVAQARLDTAADLADATLAGATRNGWLRPTPSDEPGLDPHNAAETWARVALLWRQVLTDTDAFTRARADPTESCHLDPAAIRTWLSTSTDDKTVADELLGDEFDLSGFHKWAHITNLVAAAQDAGVFGIPDQRIDILHIAGERGYINRHRVTLTAPGHGTVCSADIDTVELLTDHLAGIDAAVHLLTVLADETDHLVAQRALLADIPTRATMASTQSVPAVDPPALIFAASERGSTARTDSTVDGHALATGPPRTGKAFPPIEGDAAVTPAAGTPTRTPTAPAARRTR